MSDSEVTYDEAGEPSLGTDWSIRSLDDADWALSRLADIEREIAENTAIGERRSADIRMRTDSLNEKANRKAAYFRMKLTAFAELHRKELLGGGKKKTRDLPSGSISFRQKGGGLVVNDKDALLAWARAQPIEKGFLRFKEEPAIDEVKRHYTSTGEIPPGMDVEPERDEVVVKTAVKGDA